MRIPKIETFTINRPNRKSQNWAQISPLPNHIKALNEIGTSKSLHGVSITEEEYLSTYIATPNERFKIETISQLNVSGYDKLLVIKVTI